MNDPGIDALVGERLDLLHRLATAWRVPGFSLAVTRGAGSATYAWGMRDTGRSLPMTVSTRVPLGSLSKALIAAVAAQRVAEQVTGWSSPAGSFLPAGHRDVSLAHMLSHSSGMPSYDLLLHYGPDDTRAALLDRLAHLAGAREPGTAYLYSNIMYIAACGVLESLTGVPWEEQYQALLRAIGVKGHPLGAAGGAVAAPHLWDEERGAFVAGENERIPPLAQPIAGLTCDSLEMVAVMRLHLFGTGGSAPLLGEDALAELRRSRIRVPDVGYPASATVTGYGLGWVTGLLQGHELLVHAGNVGDTRGMTALLPTLGVGVSLLCNTDCRHSPTHPECCFPCAVVFRVIDWLCGTTSMPAGEPAPPPAPRAGAAPAVRPVHAAAEGDLAGAYAHPGFGTMTVARTDDDHLALRYGRFGGLLTRPRPDTLCAFSHGGDGPVVQVRRAGRSLLARMDPSVPSFTFTPE
ncbi:serine hydrolase domain-containing protein [Nonomuraea sp. NPDC050783]|uniref:serine hydrolase domain-containing protein n=1 Tax=Nonomuraea sp. NPDC050783 TaxID=3154634 RepID=UPI0034652944